jgi:hypothetical protein
MGARLLAVALDLLAPALVAGARYSSSLLQGRRLRGLIVADVIARRILLAEFRRVFVLDFIRARTARV